MENVQIGNEIFVHTSTYSPRWGVQYVDDGSSHCDITLRRYSTAGVFSETVATLDGGTGNIAITGDVAITGALDVSAGYVGPYRALTNDAACEITSADAGGTIELLNSTTGNKAITTDTSGAGAVELGQEVTIFLTACTGNSYTLALSTGTLTFNAALECAKVVRTSLGWNVVSLNGATIV